MSAAADQLVQVMRHTGSGIAWMPQVFGPAGNAGVGDGGLSSGQRRLVAPRNEIVSCFVRWGCGTGEVAEALLVALVEHGAIERQGPFFSIALVSAGGERVASAFWDDRAAREAVLRACAAFPSVGSLLSPAASEADVHSSPSEASGASLSHSSGGSDKSRKNKVAAMGLTMRANGKKPTRKEYAAAVDAAMVRYGSESVASSTAVGVSSSSSTPIGSAPWSSSASPMGGSPHTMSFSPSSTTIPPAAPPGVGGSISSAPAMGLPSDVALEEDQDILYFEDDGPAEQKLRRIRAASLEKLVERLTAHNLSDSNMRDAFLLTYRSFLSAAGLVHLLHGRFFHPPLSVQLLPERLLAVRLKTVSVLKTWLDRYPQDFAVPEARKELAAFLEAVPSVASASVAEPLRKAYEKAFPNGNPVQRRSAREVQPISDIDRGNPEGVECSLDTVSSDVLAYALSVSGAQLYAAIADTEYLGKAWSGARRASEAPGILAMVNQFNLVSWWVTSEIVHKVKLRDRVQLVETLLHAAKKCLDLNNFNGVFIIMSGLYSSPVRRLKKTWAEIEGSPALASLIQSLLRVTSHEANFKHYRNLLRSVSPPMTPYVGVFLTDLTFICDGNADHVDGMLNWHKQTMIAHVISELDLYRSLYPPLLAEAQGVSALMALLQNPRSVGQELAYSLSLKLEPRDTSEAIETLLMEEERLRNTITQLQVRVDELEQKNVGLAADNARLMGLLRRHRIMSTYASTVTGSAAAAVAALARASLEMESGEEEPSPSSADSVDGFEDDVSPPPLDPLAASRHSAGLPFKPAPPPRPAPNPRSTVPPPRPPRQ